MGVYTGSTFWKIRDFSTAYGCHGLISSICLILDQVHQVRAVTTMDAGTPAPLRIPKLLSAVGYAVWKMVQDLPHPK